MKSGISSSDSASLSINRGASFVEPKMFGTRQRAFINVFDGDAMYRTSSGSEVAGVELLPEQGHEVYEEGMIEVFGGRFFKPTNAKKIIRTHNLVVTQGLEWLASLLANGSTAPNATTLWPDGLALGTGTTAAAAGDTGLETPVTNGFKVFEAGYPQLKSGAADTVQFKSAWAAGVVNGNALTEVVLTAGSGTTATASSALNRIVFSSVTLGANDTLDITVEWTFG
jgi:hypothetical protein